MIQAPLTDIGNTVKADLANASATAAGAAIATVAGATEDGVEVEGETIDMRGYQSLKLCIPWLASLADAETFSLTVKEQQSSDDSAWDTATTTLALEVQATSSGGTNENGCREISIDCSGKKRYVRYNITPTLSAGSTDLAVWAAVAVKGGAEALPAT